MLNHFAAVYWKNQKLKIFPLHNRMVGYKNKLIRGYKVEQVSHVLYRKFFVYPTILVLCMRKFLKKIPYTASKSLDLQKIVLNKKCILHNCTTSENFVNVSWVKKVVKKNIFLKLNNYG